jgi:hypothetical protein
MTSFRLGGVLLAALTLLSTVLAGTATAEHRPSSRLSLTVEGPRGASAIVRLECRPAGGTHPTPRPACREIDRAAGDFDKLPGSPEMTACTMEYRPVTASARGRWNGEWVRWQRQYPNRCALLSKTGVVFDF